MIKSSVKKTENGRRERKLKIIEKILSFNNNDNI